MVETDSSSGKKRVGGRENKGNLEGGTDELLEEKTSVEIIEEKCKDFTQVGWILDYGLRLREEKGWAGGKRKQLRIELGKDEEARVNLTRNAPDEKRREPAIGKKQLRDPKEKFEREKE